MNRKVIRNFENYTIDEFGVIYDNDNNAVKTFINPCNYVSVVLDGKILTVAYIMAKTWLNDSGLCVGYRDGNYNNLHYSNLYWYAEEINRLILVDTDGEMKEVFTDIFEANEKLNLTIGSIKQKARFSNKILINNTYFIFWENEYNEEVFNKRLAEYKSIKIEIENKRLIKQKAREEKLKRMVAKQAEKAARQTTIQTPKPIIKTTSKAIIEFDSNGNIIKEYDCFYICMEKLHIGYKRLKRIMEVTGKYNNHYFLYKNIFEKISDIDELIRKVDLLEQSYLKPKKEKIIKEKKIKPQKEEKGIKPIKEKVIKEKKIKPIKETKIKPIKEKVTNTTVKPDKGYIKKPKPKKKIIKYDNSANVIEVYNSTVECIKDNDLNYSNLIHHLNGRSKNYKGYIYRYENDSFITDANRQKRQYTTIKENPKLKIVEVNKNGDIIETFDSNQEANKKYNFDVSAAIKAKRLTPNKTFLIKEMKYNDEVFNKVYKPLFKTKRINNRKVKQFDMDGNFIKEWNNTREVIEQLGIIEQSLYNHFHGKTKSCGGFIFRRED